MRLLQTFAIAGLLSVATAADALTYTFSAAPDNGWTPFSFSFNTPTFLNAGDPIPLVSFTVTNGSFSYLIDNSASTSLASQGRCFLFGTGDQVFPNGDNVQCSLFSPPAGDADMWFYDGNPTFPNALGTYSNQYLFILAGDAPSGTDFNAVITISNVPEPATWSLLIGGFTVIGGVMRRRRLARVLA